MPLTRQSSDTSAFLIAASPPNSRRSAFAFAVPTPFTFSRTDVFSALRFPPIIFDIVFIDPPYAKRLLPSALKAIYDNSLVKDTSIIICEDEQEGLMEDTDVASRYSLSKQSRYGRVIIYYLSPKAAE